MDATDTIREMLRISGKSAAQVSREMGHSKDYLNVTLSRGNSPRANTLARIAEACGGKLQVVIGDEAIEIDAGSEG